MDLNYKGLLQNFCQKMKVELPRYNCTQRVQDKHPLFLATVFAMGRTFASESEFSNKKQAEKSAANVALRELGILPDEKTKDVEPSAAEGQGSDTQGTSQDGENSRETTPGLESKEEHSILSSLPKDTNVVTPSHSQQSNAFSSGSNVSFKNILQERAQKMGLALPQYETEYQGSGFVCTVTFNGQCYKSEGFSPSKKHAQQSAACAALNLFSTGSSGCGESPGQASNTPLVYESPYAVVKPGGVSYKNLLQEHCQQRGNKLPTYTTVWEGPGFSCTVHFGTQTESFKGLCTSNKKQAEQMAAREALVASGITNPEEFLNNRSTRKNKSRRILPKRFAPTGGFSRTSWVHPHMARGPYDHSWGDLDYYWEQAVSRKRPHFDLDEPPPGKTSKPEVETFDLPIEHRRDLTVAELWKEKKNIAIVGDSESSFILYCTRVPGTCNLFNTRTMSLVSLEPGCRIIGMDARYADLNGKVALQAERCADIITPEIPDPVLTSCGVVLLYQDPQKNSIQVLLKRYLSSQAFVNVAAALAQYFRRRISGRVASLDVPCLTEHIRDWMQQEVTNIAKMNSAALRQVFAYMWKFNEKWCEVLEPPLPLDLQILKAKALDELSRRQASDVQHPEDFYHPWSLPKGNFKHRMLSTGLFIEPPANCAVRELKEETGIKLDASELKHCPWIDLPQPDNFYNPHKGDIVRYFLYVYQRNTTDEGSELDTSQTPDQTDASLTETDNSFDEDAAFFPKFPSLDASTEEEADEQEMPGTCIDADAEIDKQYAVEIKINVEMDAEKSHNPAALLHDVQSSEENNDNNPAMLIRSGSPIEKSFEQCVSGGTAADVEQRGIKRKRDDDNDDIPFQISGEKRKAPEQATTSTFYEQGQSALKTPTLQNRQEVLTAKSPHVQGGVHEECSWFLVEEARIKSPAFKQVYQTKQFQDILLSVSKGETKYCSTVVTSLCSNFNKTTCTDLSLLNH